MNSPGCSPPVNCVEIAEVGGRGVARAFGQPGVDAVEGLDEQILDVGHAIGGSPVMDGENLLFRVAQQFLGVIGRIPGIAENLGAGVDQLPYRGLVADDFRIVGRIGRIRDRLGHFGQVGCAADRLVLAFLLQAFDQEGDVDPLSLFVHRNQITIQPLVGVGIKISVPQHERDFVAHLRIQQEAAQNALFRLQVLRRQAIEDFGIQSRGRAGPLRAI